MADTFKMRALIIVTILLISATSPKVQSLDNGLALTPPMGWIPWVRFTNTVDCASYPNDCIDERLFRQMADRIATDGYAEVGYKFVNLDDCWSAKERNETSGNLMVDESRFPNGLNGLSYYLFTKNLKLGIYGDCGTATCDGYPAQLKSTTDLEDNYFDRDAEQFAGWEVNSLKFDGCNLEAEKQELICPKMAASLAKTRRPILLICEYPFYMLRNHLEPNWTLVSESCNTWRYSEDVEDSWLSILNIVDYTVRMQTTIALHHGPGHWFDPDQLVIGNWALSVDEARAQMALWCIWSAPLYMGNDLRSIAPQMAAILKNKKLIEVDQDKLGLFGLMIKEQNEQQVFVKIVEPIEYGCPSFVIVYLNRATLGNTRKVSFNLRQLLTNKPIGLTLAAERQRQVYPSVRAPIEVDRCKLLLRNGMTRERAPISPAELLVKPVKGSTSLSDQPQVPLEEKQVEFSVDDLFGDQLEQTSLALNSSLTLRVNPSGVRVVKLSLKLVD